jgi:amino acid transporter
VVAGVLATSGALCFAELGAAFPLTGGNYAFLRQSYSNKAISFFFGWSLFLAVAPAPVAAVATAFALYSGFFLQRLLPYGPTTVKSVAIGCIALLTAMNYIGVRIGGRIQNIFTSLKIAALAVVVAAAFSARGGSFSHLAYAEHFGEGTARLSAFGTAMIATLFAYEGWSYSTYVAGEIKNPRRNVPRSIILGMATVLLVYLVVNLAYMYALPFHQLMSSTLVATDTMTAIRGPRGAAFVAAAVIVSTFGTINAQLLSFPRAFYAMAQDGMFFGFARRIHPRFKTPSTAILLQGSMSAAFAASGTYEDILKYVSFVEYLFIFVTVVGLFILRVKAPELPRPYRVLAYPLTPFLFLGITAWFLINTLTHSFRESLVGVVLTLSGLPFYLHWRSRPPKLP